MQQIVSVRNRARFRAPSAPAPVVARDRLDDLYAEAHGRVLRMVAPPGYGKSTQIARWVAGDGRHVGWIDVEPVDNDALVLAAAIVRALSNDGEEPETLPAADGFEGAALVDHLTAEVGLLIEHDPRPFVLVLDDLHHIGSAEATSVVDSVAEHVPAGSTVVLCGRSLPDQGSLARRRLRPGVVDVTAAHLALDATETDELLRSMGVSLELEALSRLCDQFEGWAAGLRLAGLALKGEGERAWMSAAHVGDTTYVVDYLRSEWTGQLSPDDRQFMCEIACLNRFTGEMCDQILGRTRSLAHLRHLHREELLVLPLDQRDEWFRMHPLLARWLSSDLEETDPARWRAIHGAAASWWSKQGDIDLAVEHAVTGGDLPTALDLVTEHGFTYLTRGLQPTVRRWLDAFASDHTNASAGLSIVRSFEALQVGEGARALHWYEHAARLLSSPNATAVDDRLLRRAAVLQITLAREPAADLIPVAEAACRDVAGEIWLGLALCATGGLRFLGGDDRAAEALEAAAFVAEVNEAWVHQANCLAARGILAELSGDRASAVEASQRASELLRRWPTNVPPTTALVDALTAVVAGRAGERDVAAEHLERGLQKLVAFNSVAPWFNTLCGLALTRAAVLIDDRTASRTLLRELEHTLRDEDPGNGAGAHVAALRDSIDAARQLPTGPAWALTEAELKVLRYLPTNLTLADIATRLFVSRNTVKSHVAAIYRKLDTTSRSEAVEHARETGLLDDGQGESRE